MSSSYLSEENRKRKITTGETAIGLSTQNSVILTFTKLSKKIITSVSLHKMGRNFVNQHTEPEVRRMKYRALRNCGYSSKAALRMRDWTNNHVSSVIQLKPEFMF
jgi:hypothetical protein